MVLVAANGPSTLRSTASVWISAWQYGNKVIGPAHRERIRPFVPPAPGFFVAQAAHSLFDDFKRLDEGPFHAVRVPGQKGNWVLVIQPYCK
jgi:hypothetical protein